MQSAVLRALKAAMKPNATERMRNKITRWRESPLGAHGLPGHMSPVILRRIVRLGQLVNPRVHAAVFRALFNGWCSHRRSPKRLAKSNRCVFKCGGEAEDSIEHYCRCPVIMRVARHMMHIDYPSSLALDIWILNSGWLYLWVLGCSCMVHIRG